ncbi:hypothetical protein N7528_008998 [Penicillium herquei]|nr:hypothetical protein N7528_008998 [Penicillium herquei]
MSTKTASAPKDPKDNEMADFGDFVSTEDEEIDVEEVAEPWQKYDGRETSNVFYPIYIGEVLDERYLVEHKLGFGGFSTVWMAHDLHEKRDVALKVMSSGEHGDYEIRIQDEIIQNIPDTSHLVTYLATFLLHRNIYYHRVLVLPLMGPCLDGILLGKMTMATRMSAARQLLEALEVLHKAGIVHRDLNERNSLGRPLKEIIPCVELWKQGELVRPADVPENLRTEAFYLGDFGLAMKLGDPITQSGYPPVQFCSPDRLHGKHPSFACDIWSYMIIFAELYLGYLPFHSFLDGGIVASFARCLGPLPEKWKDLYAHPGRLDSWYDQRQAPDPKHNLEATIARFRPDADPSERKLVQSVISKVFTYCPEKRLTATQLLQGPSFRTIMDKYGC